MEGMGKSRELKRGAGAKVQTQADFQRPPQEGMGEDRASSSEGPQQKFKPKTALQTCAWMPLAALRVVWPCALLARLAASEFLESLANGEGQTLGET